ncbi:MAG: polyphosphate polymerase domain-containing protein [Lachnospiraceae bacterium]|nr:polyphosphate polymerase domain-containing protein [Lachnospira sp.]MBR6697612.1 polyphosphate polymerase domain-containing protein [Lachnospiraceae bacterium]
MGSNAKFKRYELKYIINRQQYENIFNALTQHMQKDKYYRSKVCSLYYDTPDKRLIRRSIEKPVYKEKMRIRSYGVPNGDTKVFVELKKKYKGIVYKRRIEVPYDIATNYLLGDDSYIKDSQIKREIDYFKAYYAPLEPSMFLSYERIALVGNEDKALRITFDTNIMYREYDLSLKSGIYGEKILNDDQVLMEIKIDGGMPLWLTDILSTNRAYKTSFSKYGTAYGLSCKKERMKDCG